MKAARQLIKCNIEILSLSQQQLPLKDVFVYGTERTET